MTKAKKRVYYFDYIKVFAIFLFVFNHTNYRGFFLFAKETNSPMFYPYMLISIACKIAVPLLFMVSGALLLAKTESLKVLWHKRILKYLSVIIIFSFVRYLFSVYITKEFTPFTLLGFFRYIYAAPIETPYWFLYAYLAGFIMLPFLRGIANSLSDHEFKYLFLLQILLGGILPILQYVFRMGSLNLDVPIITNNIIFYMLLGYYLHNRRSDLSQNKSFMIMASIFSLIAMGLSMYMTIYQYGITNILSENTSQTFFMSFTPLYVVIVFLEFQKIEHKVNVSRNHRILNYFSSSVFGVYLLEEMFRISLMPIYTSLKSVVGSFTACIIWVVVVVIVGATVTNLLKRLPLVKRIL